MKATLGALAFIGLPILALIAAGYIANATPEWLQASIIVFLFAVLPIWGFVKLVKFVKESL